MLKTKRTFSKVNFKDEHLFTRGEKGYITYKSGHASRVRVGSRDVHESYSQHPYAAQDAD